MDDAPPPLKRKRGEERQQVDLPCLGGCCELPCACGAQSDADEGQIASSEEVLLPGADDPSAAEQFALWKERRFIDIWLQVRRRAARTWRPGRSPASHNRRHPLAPRSPPSLRAPHPPRPSPRQAGDAGAPEGPRIPGTRMLLASVSPYVRKLLLGSQAIPGLEGDVMYVGVAGGSAALALLVEARPLPPALGPLTRRPRPSTPAACACTSPAPPACLRS